MSKSGKIALVCVAIACVTVLVGVIGVVVPPEEMFNPMFYEADPDDYGYINYTNEAQAMTAANEQLVNMSVGGVQTLSYIGNLTNGKFFVDNTMGGVLFWEITDGEITVRLDACNGEIIAYSRTMETDGPSMTLAQVTNVADNLANQFNQLPADRDSVNAKTMVTAEVLTYDPEENETTVDEMGYHILRYNRTKSGVIVSDHIEIWTFQDGNISLYYKDWNMDLDQFTVSYSLTSSDAADVALDYMDEDGAVIQTYQMIVRPNDFWDDDDNGNYTWSQPACVWVVWLIDSSGDLCIIHVHGTTGNIVGGDYIENYSG